MSDEDFTGYELLLFITYCRSILSSFVINNDLLCRTFVDLSITGCASLSRISQCLYSISMLLSFYREILTTCQRYKMNNELTMFGTLCSTNVSFETYRE
jgi:hypothetical protein